MKLYYYDHCPFCTRVRMMLALRDIPCTYTILANDDEKTPIDLIGVKMLPILVKDDGTAIGESLDIIAYLDGLDDRTLDNHVRPPLQQLLDKMHQYANHLIMPRSIKLGFTEFATPAAIAYYVDKKTKLIGDFATNLARSAEYIRELDADLHTLDALILSADAANGKAAGMEDILLYPGLRNLTATKGISWPAGVRAYLDSISKQTDIPLLYDRAI